TIEARLKHPAFPYEQPCPGAERSTNVTAWSRRTRAAADARPTTPAPMTRVCGRLDILLATNDRPESFNVLPLPVAVLPDVSRIRSAPCSCHPFFLVFGNAS